MLRFLFLLTAAVLAIDGWTHVIHPFVGRDTMGIYDIDSDNLKEQMIDGAVIKLPFKTKEVRVQLHKYHVSELADTFMLKGVDNSIRGSLTFAAPHTYIQLRTDTERIMIKPTHEKNIGYNNLHEMYEGGSGRSEINCHVENEGVSISTRDVFNYTGPLSFGNEKRVLRLALSVTVQYLQAFGSEPIIIAISMVNALNEEHFKKFAVTFEIIPESVDLVSRNGADIISVNNDDPVAVMNANSEWILNVKNISADAFDIGHVLFYSPGDSFAGSAVVGSVCSASPETRCKGASGRSGFGFDFIDEVFAHFLGHQLGAQHTFNTDAPLCVDRRVASSAVEPGAGLTIMALPRQCGAAEQIFDSGPAKYAWLSILQMNSVINDQCPPGVSNPGDVIITDKSADYTVPRETSFVLAVEAGSTAPNTEMTYSIDEVDIGTASLLAQGDLGDNPLFIPFSPINRRYRFFEVEPGFAIAKGMIPPTTNREINFRGFVYDNAEAGGHVAVSDVITVNVDASKGPFRITKPTRSPFDNPGYFVGAEVELEWDVAGTDELSSDLCVLLVDPKDAIAERRGYCVGVLPNTGRGSFKIPRETFTGISKVRLQGKEPNFFYASVAINVGGGGNGYKGNAGCPSECFVANIEAAAANINWCLFD